MQEHQSPKSAALLGQSLKRLRETKKESLAEAAGAVEIDEQHLERIESGSELPSEDILILLANHFSIDDQSASRLRQLAGYDIQPDFPPQGTVKLPVVLVGLDQRVIYSDGIHIDINPSGVVLNFLQNAAAPNQPIVPVSRVGMSHNQAMAVMKTLEQAILHARYSPPHPELPSGGQDKTK